MFCRVRGCKNNKITNGDESVLFFSFPEQFDKRVKWFELCGSIDITKQHNHKPVICQIHFDQDAFVSSEDEMKCTVLKNDAVPRLFMPEIKSSPMDDFDDATESLFGNQNLVGKERQANESQKEILEMLETKIKKLSVHPKKHLQLRFAPKPQYIQHKRKMKTTSTQLGLRLKLQLLRRQLGDQMRRDKRQSTSTQCREPEPTILD